MKGVALSRAEMVRRVQRTIEREIPQKAVLAQTDLLVALGLAPVGFDYLAAVVSLMGSELAGYYEPSEKTMYLASDLGPAEREATLAHELVHALQDQHHDLGRLMKFEPDASDAQAALHTLAEGDATSAMLDRILAPQGARALDLPEEVLGVQVRAAAELGMGGAEVPQILKRSLIAPYVDGVAFVHALRRRGGWTEVDRAWRAGPVSTEQVLHPEKFVAGERPVVVAPPPGPTQGFPSAPYTDVMGEQSVRQLFEEWLPRRPAVQAASGWAGDRIAVYREGARVAVAWRLRYDDVDGAVRGESALLRGVTAHVPVTPEKRLGSQKCAERADRGPILVERRHRDIAVVLGPYEHTVGSSRAVSAGDCPAAALWARRILSTP